MRIIAGTHKGRRLRIPKNLAVRPTTDRAKEALFSILNHKLNFESARVLDLYKLTMRPLLLWASVPLSWA